VIGFIAFNITCDFSA